MDSENDEEEVDEEEVTQHVYGYGEADAEDSADKEDAGEAYEDHPRAQSVKVCLLLDCTTFNL